MSEADRIRVLVVDSEEHIRTLLADHLCRVCGYLVDTAMDHEEAIQVVQQAGGGYDLVLIDQGLHPDDNLETIKAIKALYPSVEVAIFTDESDRESAVRAMREGAYGYIPKPLDVDEVAVLIESAAERRRLRQALETTSRERELLHGVLNVSNAVQSTLELDEVLETILSGVRQLGYDRVRLYLLSEEEKELKGKMQLGRQSDFEGLKLPLEGKEADVYSLETLAGKKPRLYKAGELGPDRWAARLDKQSLSEWVELPLLAKGRPIGKITIDNKESKRQIEESELGPLMLYANQAAMAIENAILFEETKRRLGEVNALFAVGKEITGTLELDEVLDLIVESAVAAFPTAEKGSIHLYDEKTGMLHIRSSLGYSPEVIEALTLKVGEGRTGWVYEHATPLVVGNAQEDKRSRRVDRKVKHPEVQEQKSAICVPLAIEDRVIGTLSLDNVTAFDAFKPEDLGLLSIFASQAAVAIMNAELMTKNRERLGKLEMLSRASNEMMSNLHSLSFDDRLNLIVKHAAKILDAEAGSILLVKRPGFLTKEACYGHLESDFQKGREFAIKSGRKTGLTGHIAYTCELFNAHGDDLVGHWAVAGKEPAHVASGKCYSLLAIPLKRRADNWEQLIGLLEVENKKDKDGQPKGHISFTQEDEWILSIFAKTVVICLENAELYERTSDRLEEKVISLKAIQETGAAISAELDLDELLDSITERAAKVFASPAASLMLWDNGGENLVVRAKYGLTDEYTQQRVPREKADTVIALMDGLRRSATVDLRSTPFGRLDLIEAEHLCSVLSTSLVVSDRLIGILNVYSKDEPRQFTADEIEVAEVLASQAAVAIRNAQLYEEATKRANALQALYQASQAVTGTLTRDELLNHIVEQAWRLAEPRGEKTHFSHLALADGNRIRFVAAHPPEALARLRDRIHEIDLEKDARIGITGRAALTRQSQLVGSVFQDSDYIDTDPYVHSQLSVPIQMGEQVIGIISVEHPDSNAFNTEDQQVLESLAAQAAVAIENARLYEREQRRAREAEAMVQVGQAISSTLDLDKILETVAKNALPLLGLEDGMSSIILVDEKTGDLVRSARVPPRKDGNGPRRSGGLTSLVIETGEPIVIPDVRRDSRVKASVVEEGVQSVIGVPLKVKEKTIGVLFADTFCPRDFTQHDIEMLSNLASQAAVAIENAKQYEELRQAHEDLAAATTMAWLGISGAEWSHAVNQKTSAICFNVNTLRDLIHSSDEVSSQEILDDIERAARGIQNIPMKGPLPAQMGEPVSPTVVDEVLQEWLPRWCEASTNVELDLQLCCGNEFAHIDDSWLAIALEKLVSNALKAMPNGGRLTVASRVINHDRLEIIVEDTGFGIPEEALAHFLRGRVPPEARRDRTGSGMGTLIARFILRSYGGDLELLRTGEGKGTALRVLLPVARKSP